MSCSYGFVITTLFLAGCSFAGALPKKRQLDRGSPGVLLADRQYSCGLGDVPHYPEVAEEHTKSCGSANSACKPSDPLDVLESAFSDLDSKFSEGAGDFDELRPKVLEIAQQLAGNPAMQEAYGNGVVMPLFPAYALVHSDSSSQPPHIENSAWRGLEYFGAQQGLCPKSGSLCGCGYLLCEDNHVSAVVLTKNKDWKPFRSLLPLKRFSKLHTLAIGQNTFRPKAWTQLGKAQLPQLRTLTLYLKKLNDAHIRELPRIAPRLKFLNLEVMYDQDHPKDSAALHAKALEPLCKLQGLQALTIFGPFTGLPDCFGDLAQLLHLDVRGAWLQHPLPQSFSKLTELRTFIAFGQREHHCHEAGCVSSWDNRISNEDAPVFWCPAGGWDVPLSSVAMPEWSNMEKFWVDQNFLTGPLPRWIPDRWPRLRSLDLYSNRLTGGIPDELLAMPQLFQVQLHDNLLSGEAPSSTEFSSALRFIDVSMNPSLEGCWPLVEPMASDTSGTVSLAARSRIKRRQTCANHEREDDVSVLIGNHGQQKALLRRATGVHP